MSITQLFRNDEFFITVDPKEFRPGQICRVPVPIPDSIPRILDAERNTPEDHEKISFEIRAADKRDDFKKRDRSLPVKYLNLRSNEELLVQRCKKRPAIILGNSVDCYPFITKILKNTTKMHQQKDCLFVIPCYRTMEKTYGSGIIQPIVEYTKCMMYRQFFYIPPIKDFKETIARFDKIQIVIGRSPASIEPSDVCLSEEIFNLFISMFIFCISGRTDPMFDDIRGVLALNSHNLTHLTQPILHVRKAAGAIFF